MRNINKRDFVTILSLWIIFFVIASHNLGLRKVPESSWEVSGNDGFYIDLDGEKNVSELTFLLKKGKINFDIFTGQPGNWTKKQTLLVDDYFKWKRIDINQPTSYLKIDFQRSYGELLEIAVIGEGRLIDISLYRENGEKESLFPLTDEQEQISIPINYESETIFDEIYYVRAAEDYLSGVEPYENTHPPLGKLIIATGISIFGFNPFGWRIMGVIFASSMLPIIYFLGKELSGAWFGGLISSLLLMFDFMHFTLSRIATIDTFLVFFILGSQLFFYKYTLDVHKNGWEASLNQYFIAVFMLALGFSIKWTAIFSYFADLFYLSLLVFNLAQKKLKNNYFKFFINKKIIYAFTGSVTIFGLVYLISYVPYMRLGHSLMDVYNSQWFMLKYHSELTATHPFSSPWYTWPLILRPVWLYVSDLGEGVVSTIVLMGNPAIWWMGLALIITISEKAVKEQNSSYLYIITMFFFQWIPYSFFTRSLFLYHFYPNTTIFCICASTQIYRKWIEKNTIWKEMTYLFMVITCYLIFYPIISGSPISLWWRNFLKWFPSWDF